MKQLPWTFPDQHLASLRGAYAGSGALFLNADAVYAIGPAALGTLGASPLWTPAQVKAERDFTADCDNLHAVGVRGNLPVNYGLLTATAPAVDPALAADLGWTKADLAALDGVAGKLDSTRGRLLGVTGRLVTLPSFLAETGTLRRHYFDLPEVDRPGWPLRRPVRHPAPGEGDREVSRVPGDFAALLAAHLDRWGLMSLADWDLPDPQGPLLPSDLPAGAPAEPAHGIRIVVPLHYPLQGDDDLLRQVKLFQEQAVKDSGLPDGLAGVERHGQFAQLFRLVRLEAALRSRWPVPPPRGAVGQIERAAAEVLGVGLETVGRMRKWVAGLRSGTLKTLPDRRG